MREAGIRVPEKRVRSLLLRYTTGVPSPLPQIIPAISSSVRCLRFMVAPMSMGEHNKYVRSVSIDHLTLTRLSPLRKGSEDLNKEARRQKAVVVAVGPRHLAQIIAWPDELIALADNHPGSRIVEAEVPLDGSKPERPRAGPVVCSDRSCGRTRRPERCRAWSCILSLNDHCTHFTQRLQYTCFAIGL